MTPWNALPWNIILTIIGISLFIPSVLTILFIKFRRFEDLGLALGVFLLLLGTVSYFYLIPNEVVGNVMLPENYNWEDTGTVKYWERNSVFSNDLNQQGTQLSLEQLMPNRSPIIRNFIGKEVIHAAAYNSEKKQMLINDVIYDENSEILSVINNKEKVNEWYYINPKLSDLNYVDVDGGHMGIPSNYQGVLKTSVGWVESQGKQDGKENVVFVRDMQKIKTGTIDGVDVAVWQSDIYNKPITWHGDSYICDETLQLIVNQKTGYVVHVYRHLMLYAHLSQFVKLYYPDALKYRVVTKYLALNDPIGEAAELTYETTNQSQARHIAEVKGIDAYMTYLPLLICIPMFIFGAAFTWRYWGRSYYWKRYKDFEKNASLPQKKRKRPHVKIFAVTASIIIILSSVGYILLTSIGKQNEISSNIEQSKNELTPEEQPPTPPGLTRGIDSGRHVLQPADEGAHKLSRREWWYFNVFFDDPGSDLQNHSMVISFNRMAMNDVRFLKRDNFFLILYDNEGAVNDFSILNKRRGTLKTDGPGVDINFENSYAKGQYPNWYVHAVSEKGDFVVDLTYTADFMPVWVMGRSSNLLLGYFGGDYYVPRCLVEGNITWEGKKYHVSGTGYHDHVWQTTAPRFVTKGWEWFNIHFDNGWEMYISKFIFRTPGDRYAAALIISPNNKNIVECKYFTVEYNKTARAKDLPFMTYPLEYHIEANQNGISLNLDITVLEPCEIVFKLGRTGMFEGPCAAKGTISWSSYTVNLRGYGMSETTRVKYLLELPGFLSKIMQRLIPHKQFSLGSVLPPFH